MSSALLLPGGQSVRSDVSGESTYDHKLVAPCGSAFCLCVYKECGNSLASIQRYNPDDMSDDTIYCRAEEELVRYLPALGGERPLVLDQGCPHSCDTASFECNYGQAASNKRGWR